VGLRDALARGALVDDRHEGWTPLMCAAKSRRAGVDALAVLVESGADLEAERKAGKRTEQRPLQLAIRAGDLPKVQYLVSVGARVASRSAAGYDALIDAQFARGGSRLELARYLLDHGAPVNGVSRYGETALNVAAREVRMAIERAGRRARPRGDALG
jgi:ankyrin repeat protein